MNGLGVLIVLAATGCGPPQIEATWSFEDISTGTITGCPPNPPNSIAMLRTTPVIRQDNSSGTTWVPRGAEIQDIFDCASGKGASSPLAETYPPIAYSVVLTIVDSGGTPYASSPGVILDPATVDQFPVRILNDGGYFSVYWAFYRAGQQVGGDWVRMTTTSSSGGSHSDVFPFTAGTLDGMGKPSVSELGPAFPTTTGLPAGTYNVLVEALDAQMNVIGSVAFDNRTILTCNQVTFLGRAGISVL